MTYDIEAQVRRRSRRLLFAAAAFVLLAAAVAVLWFAGGDPDDRAADPTPAGPSAAPAPMPVEPTSTTPSAAPGDLGPVTWTDVQGMTLPVSDRYGPADQTGGRATGFGQTAAGAVLAAAHITVRADAIVGPGVFRPTIAAQVTGVDREAMLGTVESDYEQRRSAAGVNPGDVLPRTHAQVAGYRVDSYTDTAAFLRLLISSPGLNAQGTVYVDFRVEMRWVDDDWRLVAPPGGEWLSATGQVASPDGYIPMPPRR
ncbi:hypothetical protein [Polymorphospora sp. NPDC050346]|uniref:hypothetical protein n=1 Tax=Polymorphospora sp. NPDC050346 TaxID=3155780 RepID=UPI0033FE422C